MSTASIFEAAFRKAASRLKAEAKDLTTIKENSNGNRGSEVQPEGAVKLRTALLFNQIAADIAEIGVPRNDQPNRNS